jgi:hypothetical protein
VPAQGSVYASGGYWDTGASTLEEGSMRGLASVISAKGDYNLSTSAAAVNLTQAQKQDIENRRQATQAYFDIREINRADSNAKRIPRLSHEQLVRVASQAAPKQISSDELNPVSGRVQWPELLQTEQFADERSKLEQLCAKHAQYGALGASECSAAGEIIEAMSGKLRELIRSVPAQQYVASKNFLKSLMYSMTKAQLG